MYTLSAKIGRHKWDALKELIAIKHKNLDQDKIAVISTQLDRVSGIMPDGCMFVPCRNVDINKVSTFANQFVIWYGVELIVLHTTEITVMEAIEIEKIANKHSDKDIKIVLFKQINADSDKKYDIEEVY